LKKRRNKHTKRKHKAQIYSRYKKAPGPGPREGEKEKGMGAKGKKKKQQKSSIGSKRPSGGSGASGEKKTPLILVKTAEKRVSISSGKDEKGTGQQAKLKTKGKMLLQATATNKGTTREGRKTLTPAKSTKGITSKCLDQKPTPPEGKRKL